MKIKLGTSPLTNTIFAGSLKKDGRTWRQGKQDVTIDALSVVVEHCLRYQKISIGNNVILTVGKKKYTITIDVSPSHEDE